MKIGDIVVIINSPYFCVKNNTIGIIKSIIYDHFDKNIHLYIVDGLNKKLRCNSFREYEIKYKTPT